MKLKHYDGDGRARFVTFGIHKNIPILTNHKFINTVITAIENSREKYNFELIGYVIMPEHVHLVIIPRLDSKIGRIIGEIKRESAIAILNYLRENKSPLLQKFIVVRNGVRKYAIWQRRCYDHNCRTVDAVKEKINYCHHNPVRRGLVNEPGAWRWSSYAWYYNGSNPALKVDSEGQIF